MSLFHRREPIQSLAVGSTCLYDKEISAQWLCYCNAMSLSVEMEYNVSVELFRDDEYPMIEGKTYLDHAGTTIYAKSLIEEFSVKMINNLYGNPHSASNPAKLSSDMVEAVREQALHFFGADPEHFDLIFTANATASIKLVAESFRDLALASSTSGTFWYGYHKDAHTSLVGVRALTEDCFHCFGSDQEVEEWLEGSQLSHTLLGDGPPGLFAYPGQSNMTGRRLPLTWTRKLRESSNPAHQNTYSLLDAAALATTTQLDFGDPDTAPDFTALSFYKIFGFPDLGALIVRKASGHILSWRRYFGGGTVNMIQVLHEATVQRKEATIHDRLEDGTLPFHSIIALGCAIDVHKRLYGSMKEISKHTSFLAHRMYTGLSNIRHPNGRALCMIYNDGCDTYLYTNAITRGAAIAFNVVRADGSYIGYSAVESLANEKGIFLRSGGLCNPGGIASCLKTEPWQFKRAWSAGYRCGESGQLDIVNGKPIGVVRASLGAMSTIADVDKLIRFMAETFVVEEENEDITARSDLLTRSGTIQMERKDSGFASATGSMSPISGYNPTSLPDPPILRAQKPKLHLQRSFCAHTKQSSSESTDPATRAPLRPLDKNRTTMSVADLRLVSEAAVKDKRSMLVSQRHHTVVRKPQTSLKFWKSWKIGLEG